MVHLIYATFNRSNIIEEKMTEMNILLGIIGFTVAMIAAIVVTALAIAK